MTRRIDQPQPGFFRRKLVKCGPWVACRIDHIAGLWSAEIDGKAAGLPHADPAKADGVMQTWIYGRPITEEHYRYMLRLAEWGAQANAGSPGGQSEIPD